MDLPHCSMVFRRFNMSTAKMWRKSTTFCWTKRQSFSQILWELKVTRILKYQITFRYTLSWKLELWTKPWNQLLLNWSPKWDKGDKNAYEDFVSRQLNSFNTPQTEYDFILSLGQLTATLKRAAYVSIPNHKTNKEIICGPKRIWNPESGEALKTCKETWWQWRQSGEPSDKDHPLVIRMKHSKRRLRKIQRQTEAKKTIEKVERIMSSEGSNKEFYRLVKDQRKMKASSLQFLCVKGKILESPDEICDGWATHFGSLATPAENIHFDNDVKKTYIEDINHILNICSASSDGINPASVEEVEVALKKLKPNKAADCLDIICDHLIYGGVSVVYFLRDMINYIFECKQVPSVLKEGLVTPIFKQDAQRATIAHLSPMCQGQISLQTS